jgi:hypothetical protein
MTDVVPERCEGADDVLPSSHVEADASGHEGPRSAVPKAKPSRDVTDGVAGWPAPPYGAENLGDDSPDARRCIGPNGEKDLGLRAGRAGAVAPGVVVDIEAEGAVSRERLLLRLSRSPVRAKRHRIHVLGAGVDPVGTPGYR